MAMPSSPPKAVFLDRDGVLNRSDVRDGKPFAPRRLEDFRLLPGVRTALERLKQAGYLLVVVTNQPDIANMLVDPATIDAMHSRLRARLPVDDVWCCPHARGDDCACRKPRPGMILAAAAKFGIDLSRSVMIGDRWGDMRAGSAAGCGTCIFIDRHYTEPRDGAHADLIAPSLPAAIRALLDRQ